MQSIVKPQLFYCSGHLKLEIREFGLSFYKSTLHCIGTVFKSGLSLTHLLTFGSWFQTLFVSNDSRPFTLMKESAIITCCLA